MASDDFTDEGFASVPPEMEPPEGALELALQEEVAATDALTPEPERPEVLGRSYAFDLVGGGFLPAGRQPARIVGDDALRQRVEKCLRDDRGAAAVHTDDYGMEGAYDLLDGEPFDGATFAELEERVRDALIALPGVLNIEEFDAEGSLESDVAVVSFRVVPEADTLEPVDFDSLAIPIS